MSEELTQDTTETEELVDFTPEPETVDNNESIEEIPEGGDSNLDGNEPPAPAKIEYPEFIDKKYHRPEKFDSTEAELEYYRNSHEHIINAYKGDEFVKNLAEEYKEHLLSKEQEIQKLKDLEAAISGRPEEYLKKYFGKELMRMGYNSSFQDEEIKNYVEEKAIQAFGEDYRSMLDPNDAVDPLSFTHKVMEMKKNWIKEYEEYNNNNRNNGGIDPKIIEDYWKGQREKYFSKMSDKSFNEFIEKATAHKPDGRDVYRIVNFDKYMEQAKKKGIEEGRKIALKEMRNAGHQVFEPKIIDTKNNSSVADVESIFGSSIRPII